MQNENGPTGWRHPRVPWSATDALVAYALVLFVTLASIVSVTWLADTDGQDTIAPSLTIAVALLQGLLVLAAWYFGIRRYGAPWSALGLVRARLRWVILIPLAGVIVSFAFTAIYVLLVTAAGIESMLPPQVPGGALGEGPARVINVAVIGVLGPLTEEIFFRGFLLVAMVAAIGLQRGAIVGSAMFALMHRDVAVMVPVFMTGLILAWLYLKTGSIWPPLVAHSTQNLIVLTVS